MTNIPLVSVVIPTRNRPEFLLRAISSVLNQTYRNLEIVVIVDGPDSATMTAMQDVSGPNVRVIELPQNVGGSEARNTGVRNAKGEWIAFLDDDDEWLPTKIEKQVMLGIRSQVPLLFVATQFVGGGKVLPTKKLDGIRSFRNPEFSDFLFRPSGFLSGGGYVQTSSWFVSRELALLTQFTPGLKRNQDVDWMLRAMRIPGASFSLVREALTISHDGDESYRVSKRYDWRFHLDWAVSNKDLFSPEAISYFLATTCAEDAGLQGQRLVGCVRILEAMFKYGRVAIRPLLILACHALVPRSLWKTLRMVTANGIRRETLEAGQ
jgi:glycosyltransferase involved in cell wall biosynthesis